MPLPEYLPKIKLATKRKYRQLVKDYGPPPEGYRWLKFGEADIINENLSSST